MRTYRFPSQETKLREGGKATVPGIDGPPSTVAIEALDRDACTITLKVGVARAELLPDRLTLHPAWPLDTKVLADRKSVVWGQSVSVRVDLGGRRILNKKNHIILTTSFWITYQNT